MISSQYPSHHLSLDNVLIVTVSFPLSPRHRDVTHRAVKFLHNCQTPEGVWYGSWGVCHTYATQFALESLSLVGETYANSERVRRACDFLVSKQMDDGGWGESWEVSQLFLSFFLSCIRGPEATFVLDSPANNKSGSTINRAKLSKRLGLSCL